MTEPGNETHDTTGVGRRSKVATVIEEHGLHGLDTALVRRWRGKNRKRERLRDFANYFDERALESALDDAGVPLLEGGVTNLYALVTGDGVSSGV